VHHRDSTGVRRFSARQHPYIGGPASPSRATPCRAQMPPPSPLVTELASPASTADSGRLSSSFAPVSIPTNYPRSPLPPASTNRALATQITGAANRPWPPASPGQRRKKVCQLCGLAPGESCNFCLFFCVLQIPAKPPRSIRSLQSDPTGALL
jgi:hypothetical protein